MTEPELVRRALDAHGAERILVSIDARGGRVATAGWTRASDVGPEQALARLGAAGVDHFVYTDVDRDGMLEGPDLEAVRRITSAPHARSVIYSGGIGHLADLQALARLRAPGLAGVIVGKALYERRFSVGEGQAALDAVAALRR
jgi:phosphoribosylformimino-5-aminoimidazole carboxamide ribotide isomerase